MEASARDVLGALDNGEFLLPSESPWLMSPLVVGSCTWQVFSLA